MDDNPSSNRQFVGSDGQYELLRSALRTLVDEGIRPEFIISQAGLNCDRGVVNKFCKQGGTNRINRKAAAEFWVYLANTRPALLGLLPSVSDRTFFHALAKYYDVSLPVEGIIDGRYCFYHYSEEFNNYRPELPCAIIVGEFCVVSSDGAITVDEIQRYDGHLGKRRMTEVKLQGYCFPKDNKFFFLMKAAAGGIPKFYVFPYFHTEGTPKRVQNMKGYMLKGSLTSPSPCFHSPVYALRVADNEPIACNIVRPDELDPDITNELANELVQVRRVSI